MRQTERGTDMAIASLRSTAAQRKQQNLEVDYPGQMIFFFCFDLTTDRSLTQDFILKSYKFNSFMQSLSMSSILFRHIYYQLKVVSVT